MIRWYIRFDNEPVLVRPSGFLTPSSGKWQRGIFDVTMFPRRAFARSALRTLRSNRTKAFARRFRLVRVTTRETP